MQEQDDATLLDRYHAQPGRTVATLGPFRDARGRSSYEVLAEEVGGLARDARLLDLACGDGHLLSLLAARGFEHIAGVDRSPQEIGAARARLGSGATLHCQDARALPLADGSIDGIVCHMALMLMDPVEAVLAEVARVLRPGGLFVAVVNRRHPDPVFETFSRELRRVTAEAGMDRLELGSADVLTARGLRAHLSRARLDEGRARIHDFVVCVRKTPGELWPIFEAMYDVFRLPAPSKDLLRRALLAAWDALADGEGRLGAEMGMRLVVCPARGVERPS
jgi:SAM-dependent methyltransferase